MIFHMAMVRTTLVLDEQAFARMKQIAAEEGRTLSSIVDETIRIGIERRNSLQQQTPSPPLPAFSMGVPRVNLADRDQLYNLIGE